jgi:hypothetical protein
MEAWEWVAIAAAAAAVVLVLLLLVELVLRRRRRAQLQERYGTEYEHAAAREGSAGADKRLSEVDREREELSIRPLPEAARERYLEEWRQVEARFVSEPEGSARAAQRLVERALEDRGYPSEADSERRAALVAVDHPDVAERYRHGRAIVEGSHDAADSTEKLREAMVDFRTVLEDVVGERQAA